MEKKNDSEEYNSAMRFFGRFIGKTVSTVGLVMILYGELGGCRELSWSPGYNSWSSPYRDHSRKSHSHTLTYVGIGVTLAGLAIAGACEEDKEEDKEKYK